MVWGKQRCPQDDKVWGLRETGQQGDGWRERERQRGHCRQPHGGMWGHWLCRERPGLAPGRRAWCLIYWQGLQIEHAWLRVMGRRVGIMHELLDGDTATSTQSQPVHEDDLDSWGLERKCWWQVRKMLGFLRGIAHWQSDWATSETRENLGDDQIFRVKGSHKITVQPSVRPWRTYSNGLGRAETVPSTVRPVGWHNPGTARVREP